MYDNPGSIPWS